MISLYTLRKAESGGGGYVGRGGIWSGGVGYRIDTCDAYGDTFKEGGGSLQSYTEDERLFGAPSRRGPSSPLDSWAWQSDRARSSSIAALMALSAQFIQIIPPWSHVSKASIDHSFGVIPSPPARGRSLPRCVKCRTQGVKKKHPAKPDRAF